MVVYERVFLNIHRSFQLLLCRVSSHFLYAFIESSSKDDTLLLEAHVLVFVDLKYHPSLSLHLCLLQVCESRSIQIFIFEIKLSLDCGEPSIGVVHGASKAPRSEPRREEGLKAKTGERSRRRERDLRALGGGKASATL